MSSINKMMSLFKVQTTKKYTSSRGVFTALLKRNPKQFFEGGALLPTTLEAALKNIPKSDDKVKNDSFR